MNELTRWLDRLVEHACRWLAWILPREHGLVSAGYRLAGLRRELLLPIDRRTGPTVHKMSYDPASFTEKAKKSEAKKGNANEWTCGFWAYCHISGQPCYRCRPSGVKWINSLYAGLEKDFVKLCNKIGKKAGTAWYGCCINPAGAIRMIAFADCCTEGSYDAAQDCATRLPWCHQWPEAKNWCWSSGTDAASQPKTYYCTIAVDIGACPS